MKTIGKRLVMAVLVLVVAAGMLIPAGAVQAAKVTKVKAVQNTEKAKGLKKGKTYRITGKEYDGELYYVKFTAPKTATYQFQFSGLTIHGEKSSECIMNGSADLRMYDEYGYLSGMEVKLGKKQTGRSIYLCSDYCATLSKKDKTDPYAYLPERTATVKLEKGTTVYVAFNLIDVCDVMLKIK